MIQTPMLRDMAMTENDCKKSMEHISDIKEDVYSHLIFL